MIPATLWRERPLALITGVMLTLGVLYFVAEFWSAALWTGSDYSFRLNYVSDLGAVVCRDLDGDFVCSPGNVIMNTGFVVQGVIIGIGGILAAHLLLPHRKIRFLVMFFLLLSAIGTVMVGLFHGSFGLPATGLNRLHWLGAGLAILFGNAGILVFAASAISHGPRLWAAFGLLAGTVGLGSLFLIRSPLRDILGTGTIERLAVNPIIIWTIGTGILILYFGLHHHREAVSEPLRILREQRREQRMLARHAHSEEIRKVPQ